MGIDDFKSFDGYDKYLRPIEGITERRLKASMASG